MTSKTRLSLAASEKVAWATNQSWLKITWNEIVPSTIIMIEIFHRVQMPIQWFCAYLIPIVLYPEINSVYAQSINQTNCVLEIRKYYNKTVAITHTFPTFANLLPHLNCGRFNCRMAGENGRIMMLTESLVWNRAQPTMILYIKSIQPHSFSILFK